MDGVLELEETEGNNSAKFVQFIGLNPSTADETKDDPTIRKCIAFAKRWGYGAFCMTNIFARRETDPEKMKLATAPIGPDNNDWIVRVAQEAAIVVAAWGNDGSFTNRGREVVKLLNFHKIPLHCLKLNQDGSPAHPLYLRGDLEPILM